MSKIIFIPRSCIKKILPIVNQRFVSTSRKNNDSATTAMCKPEPPKTQRDWVCYGFDYKSKAADRNAMHSIMFISLTVCMAVGAFYWMYLPDYNLKNWSQREAFLELRRREQNGLPLIDPNFINPAKIKLPTDEQLGDTEIII